MTLVSRIFGFVRDMIIANKLGTSATSDAFFLAMILPNLLRRLFAEGAFNVVFVPILGRIQEEKGQKAAEKFAASAYTTLAIILLVITLLAEFFMEPFISQILARGWADDPERLELAVTLGRITFPYLMLITFASLAGGICNTYGNFAPFAITPVLLNISFIAGLLILPKLGVDPAIAAASSMTFGGILQMLYMAIALKKIKFDLSFTKNIKHKEMPNLLRRLGPAALAVGILQISFLVDILLASYLEDNAVSYLQFANRFYQQPLSLIGIALATVLLPHLSKALKKQDKTAANKAFSEAAIHGFALSLFSTVTLMLLAFPLIHTLFGHGEFSLDAASLVAKAMQAYCIALPAYIMTKITVTCFYANGDTKTPLIISAITLVINVIFNLILMQKYGYIGIAFATSIAGWSNATMQFIALRKQNFIQIEDMAVFKKKMGQSMLLALATYLVITTIEFVLPYNEGGQTYIQILWLAVVGLSALCTFIYCAHLMKFFNAHDIMAAILKRRKKV
ncbi:MAG: putative peptidoglycan lipid II flippase [Alphaproteobacteria bacterium]